MDGDDRVRRLRSRRVPLPPLPLPPSPCDPAQILPCPAEPSLNSRNSRTGLAIPAGNPCRHPKRSAMTNSNNAPSQQQAKRRAALTNLTNHGGPSANIPSAAPPVVIKKDKRPAISAAKHAKGKQVVDVPPLQTKIETSTLNRKPKPASGHGSSSLLQPFEDKSLDNCETVPSPVESASAANDAILVLDKGKEESLEIEAIVPNVLETLHEVPIELSSSGGLVGHINNAHVEGHGRPSQQYTDIDTHKDPQMCSTYATEIYHHLRMAELKRRPLPDFIDSVQKDLNASMRGILIDWLVEVAEEYKLVPDTLYLSVMFIDRFLSVNVVNRQRLQLLGVASMLIASKYEEICPPQVEEFCYITDNTYCREEVLEMERQLLYNLNFELAGPTTKTFLRRFIRAAQVGQKISALEFEFLGNYLAELTLVEYGFAKYLSSMIASAAVFLARLTLAPTTNPWDGTLQHYTGYRPSELQECVKALHELQCNTRNCTLPATREKYRQHKFKCVATLTPPPLLPCFFEDLS